MNTAEFIAAQARTASTTAKLLALAWPLLDPNDLDGSTARWLATVRPIVAAGRARSTRSAGRYLTDQRREHVGDLAGFRLAGPADLPVAALNASLVVTGPVKVKGRIAAGTDPADAMEVGREASAASAIRHVLNGGRSTIHRTTRADRKALGYARRARPNCCSFCAMLAGRGPVYVSEESATRSERGNRYHDRCYCVPVPVYSLDQAWPPGSRQYAEMWRSSTAGLSGSDARAAFRRELNATRRGGLAVAA